MIIDFIARLVALIILAPISAFIVLLNVLSYALYGKQIEPDISKEIKTWNTYYH